MKYSVNIDEVINELFRKNIGFVPSFGNGYHHPIDILWFHPIWHRYHHELSWNYHEAYSTNAVCRSLINNPIWFQSPLFQLLFKTFVAAEGKFIMNYIPQKSHEERLTGHLVSELENGLFILRDFFEETSKELYGQPVPLEFYYRDLSAHNQEKYTGADLGLVFYVNLPDLPKHIRIAAIQAKKVDTNSARIDIPQLQTITNQYNEDAYYMFYDMTDRQLSPMIQRASYIKNHLNDENDQENISYSRKRIIDRGIPLSIFLIFEILQSFSTNDVNTSIWKAIKQLMRPTMSKDNSYHFPYSPNHEDNRPSKILAITIGEIDKSDLGELGDVRSMLNNEESRN